jgi:TusA-related sulfurtransferase
VAEVRALVRKLMLEELFPGEILEIRVMHPALAHAFVGQCA